MAQITELVSLLTQSINQLGGASIKHSEAIVEICARLNKIEDRLDQIQKKGKYREPGPSPYIPRKPKTEPKERFY